MRFWGIDYYVACLSAASYHGSAHQKPQVWQIITNQQKRSFQCGSFRIQFLSRKEFPEKKWIERRNVKSGYLKISSPELTAFDLVLFMLQSGGINHVATVLSELFEEIKIKNFIKTYSLNYPTSVYQRLGFLLNLLGHGRFTAIIEKVVRQFAKVYIPLVPGNTDRSVKNKKWKLFINYDVEPDL